MFVSLMLLGSNTQVDALSWDVPKYNVEIDINENTLFTVTESNTHIFTGSLNGYRRDITLDDDLKDEKCIQNPELTCGGFEFLTFESLFVDGVKQKEGEYNLYTVDDEFAKYFRIEKRLKDEETYVSREEHDFKFTYNIYGGIQWLDNDKGENVPFFYWNLLPEDRGAVVKNSEIRINFPKSVKFNENAFEIYVDSYSNVNYQYEFEERTNTLVLYFENLPYYGPITMAYEFKDGELIKPGSLEYNLISPTIGTETYFNNLQIDANSDNKFDYLPAGEYKIKFDRFGYEPETFDISISSGETEKIDVELNPEVWMVILQVIQAAAFIIGLFLTIYAPIFVYKKWERKGRDIKPIKTIVPIFSPPENIRPYLLGSLKDEKVDHVDISGTIIDLAYRGFIKIKEIKKGKNYELTKLSGKEGEELDDIEVKLMDAIFDDKESVNTKDLKSHSFSYEIKGLQKSIYKKMMTEKFFESNPETIRNNYASIGIASLGFGVAALIGGTILLSTLIGNISFFTLGLALTLFGISTSISAPFMPAKTEFGSKIFNKILGFKMYLETAERYRLQNLETEDFERYLSYAVIFGVEKQWADSFKDIYKGNPDWYEGSDVIDAYYFSRFVRDFTNTTTSSFSPPTNSSSGYASGGGWSGGSSFGGFSGGGGGGGSSGGW